MSSGNHSSADAPVIRIGSVALGVALGIVWVIALSTGATFWLTWMVALAALTCLGTAALASERGTGLLAAGNLGFIGVMLAACWIVGLLLTSTTRWLTWSCFAAALVMLTAAFVAGLDAATELIAARRGADTRP